MHKILVVLSFQNTHITDPAFLLCPHISASIVHYSAFPYLQLCIYIRSMYSYIHRLLFIPLPDTILINATIKKEISTMITTQNPATS